MRVMTLGQLGTTYARRRGMGDLLDETAAEYGAGGVLDNPLGGDPYYSGTAARSYGKKTAMRAGAVGVLVGGLLGFLAAKTFR